MSFKNERADITLNSGRAILAKASNFFERGGGVVAKEKLALLIKRLQKSEFCFY